MMAQLAFDAGRIEEALAYARRAQDMAEARFRDNPASFQAHKDVAEGLRAPFAGRFPWLRRLRAPFAGRFPWLRGLRTPFAGRFPWLRRLRTPFAGCLASWSDCTLHVA